MFMWNRQSSRIDGEYKFQVDINKIKKLRDEKGVDAEAGFYADIMREAIDLISEQLKDGGCDQEAVNKALKKFEK